MSETAQAILLADYKPYPATFHSARLSFDLGEEATLVEAEVDVAPTDPGQPLWFDGLDMELKAIWIDGVALREGADYVLEATGLRLLKYPAQRFKLGIISQIKPQDNTKLEGLYKSSGNFCSQCEAEGFRHVVYWPDRSDVLTTFTVKIVADKGKYPVLLSNGNEVASGDLEGGKHFAVWVDPFPKPCYLFALVAGDLVALQDAFTTKSGKEVMLRIFTEAHNADKTGYAMVSLKASMAWDEERFGLEYDLNQFNIVAVDDFNMGAMENKSLNIFNSRLVLASPQTATDYDYTRIEGVIGHEYFHNWTGNRVTCRDWFQLSLKEGLTVFRDQEFTGYMNSIPTKRIDDVQMLRSRQFAEDAGPMAHPVRPASYMKIDNFYTVTVYEKGAEVIRMYQTLLGRDGFRKGMDLYFQRHDGQAVTCDDFYAAMEDANGTSLGNFRLWYSQAGTPTLEVTTAYEGDVFTMRCKQTLPATPADEGEKAPQLIPIKLGLLGPDGKELPLTTVAVDGGAPAPVEVAGGNALVKLTQWEQTFAFQGVAAKPVPSVLREFSAPVVLKMDQSDEELKFLLAHDTDSFNKWESMQRLSAGLILKLYPAAVAGEALQMDGGLVEAVKSVLADKALDKEFVSLALDLPALSELVNMVPGGLADPVALHRARLFVGTEIARALKAEFVAIYQANCSDQPYSPDSASKGQRALKNGALRYLALLEGDADVKALVAAAFKGATNMTDQIAALGAIALHDTPERKQALESFRAQWEKENLVMLKWLGIQAGSNIEGNVAAVKALMEHPAFDIKNPNKVYSLVGGFTRSMVNFHNADGSGYRLLADMIITLDKLNPQVAARMVGPFTRFKKYDAARQALMKAELQRILDIKPCTNVFEIVSKSLA